MRCSPRTCAMLPPDENNDVEVSGDMRSYRIEPKPTTVWSITRRSATLTADRRSSNIDSPKRGRYESLKMDAMPVDASRPSASNSGANLVESTRSLHCALRPIIILAQIFAVFPVSGVRSSDTSNLKFTWWSFKILYCFLSTIGSAFLTIFSIYRLATTSITSNKTSNLVFSFTAGITTMLFLKLARQWPSFAVSWEKMERELAARHNPCRPAAVNLALKFKILSAVVMVLALVEHTLSILAGYVSALECAAIRNDKDIMFTYFNLQFPQMFTEPTYALWKGIIVQFVNFLSTFSWNFMDLFLILVSVALTDQFRQLNQRLYSTREKHGFVEKTMPDWWWAEARVDFNQLATMTRRVDSQISDIVLLSFSTNLYFICIQLLNSFKPMPNAIQTIYFCFSFGFLLSRTAAVSLYAATVHDESLLPAPILYSVCSASYSSEVRRFLTQVTTDNISLTGMKFFSITRSLILTVAGTIVTYELVLVQFNAVQADHQQNDNNITTVCESQGSSSFTDVKIEEF